MEWIVNNWILILIASLLVVLFFFGYRTKIGQDETHVAHHEEQAGEKVHKSGHGCCG
jgi:type VI protein secretion system component VasF